MKLPEDEGAAAGGGSRKVFAGAAGSTENLLSTATVLNDLASSSDGRDVGLYGEGSAGSFDLSDCSILVNSPGPAAAVGGGSETAEVESDAGGAGIDGIGSAVFDSIELNICVKLPGDEAAAGGAGSRWVTAGAAGSEEKPFSTATGVNDLASSTEGLDIGEEAEGVAGSEDLSDCSILVNSPGPAGGGGA